MLIDALNCSSLQSASRTGRTPPCPVWQREVQGGRVRRGLETAKRGLARYKQAQATLHECLSDSYSKVGLVINSRAKMYV